MTENRVNGDLSGFRILRVLSDTGTDHDGADQGGYAADRVNRRRTREINESELREPALRIPYPARLNRIYKQRDDRGINAVGTELCALSHRTGDNRSGGRAEHKVEYEERSVAIDEIRKVSENMQIRHADEPADVILAHHQRIAEKNENRSTDTEIHQVLHQDISGVLSAAEPALKRREPRLHEKHKRRSDKKPYAENLRRNRLGDKLHYAVCIHVGITLLS